MSWRPSLLTAGLAMTACSLNLPEVVHDDAGRSGAGGTSAAGAAGSNSGGTAGASADGGTGGTSADGGTGGTGAGGGMGGTAGTGTGGTAGNPCPDVEQLVSDGGVGFALDADNVYIANSYERPKRCPKAGCGGNPFGLNGPMDSSPGIAARGTQLYVRDAGGALWSCTTPDCGTAVPLQFPDGLDYSGTYRTLVADSSGVYAWAGGALVRFPPSEAPCALTIVSNLSSLSYRTSAIATAGSKVAYTFRPNYPDNTTLYRIEWVPTDCPTSGLHTPNVVLSGDGVLNVAAYGSTLYWISSTSGIDHCDLDNCGGDYNFTHEVDGKVNWLIADSEGVYWVTDKTISRCDHSGCGPDGPQVLACRGYASGPTGAANLALDDDYIYLRSSAGVFRASKR